MDPSSESQRHRLLSLLSRGTLTRVLQYTLNEEEFLSPFGIRSLSRYHQDNPVQAKCTLPPKENPEERREETWYEARYNPVESAANTNPQGPIIMLCKWTTLEEITFTSGYNE